MLSVTDVTACRVDFPALDRNDPGLVYLDNGATALKPRTVIDAITEYYTDYSANIHRGVYEMSARATVAYDEARVAVKTLLGVDDRQGELLFTRGTTEALNMLAYSWAQHTVQRGQRIVLTPLEHHSNLVPWQQLAQGVGAELTFLDLDAEGALTEAAIDAAIDKHTALVAITGMSNVTGYRPPLESIVRAAHNHGAAVVVDAAQLASHHPVDVTTMGVDFLTCSAHKMCGPTGIGALYARRERLEQMQPFHFGGGMIQNVGLHTATWARVPEKFEAGTPNIAGAIGFGAAARYLAGIGMQHVAAHERELGGYLNECVDKRNYLRRYGKLPIDRAAGVCSFSVPGAHPHDVGSLLDQLGIAVRTGFHCAQPLMAHFGIDGTIRASLYLYNTRDDIDRFMNALDRVVDVLG